MIAPRRKAIVEYAAPMSNYSVSICPFNSRLKFFALMFGNRGTPASTRPRIRGQMERTGRHRCEMANGPSNKHGLTGIQPIRIFSRSANFTTRDVVAPYALVAIIAFPLWGRKAIADPRVADGTRMEKWYGKTYAFPISDAIATWPRSMNIEQRPRLYEIRQFNAYAVRVVRGPYLSLAPSGPTALVVG